MSWQPIETAPRDGSWVLAYAPEGEYDSDWNDSEGRVVPVTAVVRWPIEHPGHADPGLQGNCAMWSGYYDGIGPFDGEVTHWMPLPEPPGVQK
jgi:hypothetical protein